MVPYKKYLISLITNVSSNRQLGRTKLIQIFLLWFGEDVISLYNEFKLEQRPDSEKKEKSNLVKKYSEPKEYCEKHTFVLQ